ncbi:GNAT family N-acetyltransferase [Fluviispira vulneris]|uniref:GNAT family N-acetyltransferase n=1 Tax=Fluviispira vulneris TaxID=2763012 RepID=UPI001648A246|nr:GNAT family N-acetyltransferase [Fluviispira vulneris]
MDLILKKEIELENNYIFNDVFKNGILDKYSIEKVDVDTYWDIYYREFIDHYPNEMFFTREELLDEKQKKLRLKLALTSESNNICNNLVVRDKNKIIALFRGEQKDIDVYYMRNSVVHSDYRNKGLYSDYLKKIIEYCKRMGFVEIISCHTPCNNKIIQAKLKKDFYIKGLETHTEYGLNLWLSHFLNEDLKKAFFFRCGMVEYTKKMFQNSEGNSKKLLDKLNNVSV